VNHTITQKTGSFITESELSDEEFYLPGATTAIFSESSDIINILNKKNIFPVIQKMIDKMY
jgi:primosomal protein N' (replication factor Y)